ncbi:enhanced intracellular survival protein Eis [Promethearchaeum syntrophicum]|uniref:Enhanced intracellular survival protein Eis n=1 Tax=Promethearchaeum syntrophicum TaxID=2594042 RepID=A0A5B9D9C5_9ARCH|nr:GNAT family N-acetyltransferase [Candidatus Prometheoarchaeum syntrophicum]QEE15457.1 hypothetical protein DSAG12_01283 [Candidatus Prometheoarchaeum syntrophicum]
MELIKLDQSHRESFEKLMKFSFPLEDEEENEEVALFLKNNRIWDEAYGWFDGDTLVSTYSSYSGQFKIRNKFFKVKFIDLVATLPTYRKKGLVRKGLTLELEKNFDSQFHFFSLGPFKQEFYRNLGFETVMDSRRVEFDFDFLSKKTDFQGYRTKIGILKEDSNLREDLMQVKKWMGENSRYNQAKIPELYDEVFFQMSKKYVAIAYDENSIPKGYMIFSEIEQILKITNMHYIDLQAFYALKQLLLSYQDQVKKILFTSIQPDLPIDLLIDNYWLTGKKCSVQDNSWRMFRIVNLESVLREICKEIQDNEIYLKVSDGLFNQNNGIYLFSKNKIERVDSYSGKIDAALSISDLVPLLSGRKSSYDLYLTGKLTIPGNGTIYNSKSLAPPIIAELDKIFPKVTTFGIL